MTWHLHGMGSLDATMIRRATTNVSTASPYDWIVRAEPDAGRGQRRMLRDGEVRQFVNSFAAMFVATMAFLA